MLTRLIRIAVLGVPGVFAAGCAMQPNNYGLDAGKAVLVRQTCNDIMGLNAGPELSACTTSLAESVVALQAAESLAEADQSCARQGLASGTPERAQCVVMSKRAAAGSVPATSDNALTASAQFASLSVPDAASSITQSLPKKFYFNMTHTERDERAELSCAQLGLHPAWGSFSQCVSNLQYAIGNVRYSTLH